MKWAALAFLFSLNANAVTLQSVGDLLIGGAQKEYSGTTPDGSAMDCMAGLDVRGGQLHASLTYGDTGAGLSGALSQTASVAKVNGIVEVSWKNAGDSIVLRIKDKALIAMSITLRDEFIFIPYHSTVTCENLVEIHPRN